MRYVALNGFRHPLNQYFNGRVQCINLFNWTHRLAVDLAKSFRDDVTLIGFSDGATACLTAMSHSSYIKKVYAHSPMYVSQEPRTAAHVSLFRTTGDKTPTYKQTQDNFHHLAQKNVDVLLYTLPALPALPVRNLATMVMWRKNHQFHNCLEYLPHEIIK